MAAQFLADIAGVLELFAVAAGLVLLHKATRETPSRWLRWAASLLIVGGLAAGACTTWFWWSYHRAGAFRPPATATLSELPAGDGSDAPHAELGEGG